MGQVFNREDSRAFWASDGPNDPFGMTHLALFAVDEARRRGATYADARVMDETREHIGLRNEKIVSCQQSNSLGIGIRVLVKGAWGFAATHDLNKSSIVKTARLAVAVARASALARSDHVQLAPTISQKSVWRHPVVRDPFTVPLEDKVGVLREINQSIQKVKGVTFATSSMNFKRVHQWMASSEGHDIDQLFVRSGAGFSAMAVRNGEVQIRSYPNSFGGQFEQRGYELISRLGMMDHTQQMGEEAVALLTAPECPQGQRDLVIGSSQLALQVHESCGHPIELDRVLGEEAGFMGTSFLTTDQLGKLRYGSPLVSIIADQTSEGGLGTFGFDDEGTPAQRWDIVKKGLFSGYLTSRETARKIGEPASRGCMRAESWNHVPMIRMVNISLQPNRGTLDQLLSDTAEGLLIEGTRSWSIDQQRLNFHFAAEIGWEIKRGKKVRLVKHPRYHGMTPKFWNACDAICGPEEWKLWGVPNCGKGEPLQIAEVSHGASPARFRQVSVGG